MRTLSFLPQTEQSICKIGTGFSDENLLKHHAHHSENVLVNFRGSITYLIHVNILIYPTGVIHNISPTGILHIFFLLADIQYACVSVFMCVSCVNPIDMQCS